MKDGKMLIALKSLVYVTGLIVSGMVGGIAVQARTQAVKPDPRTPGINWASRDVVSCRCKGEHEGVRASAKPLGVGDVVE